MLENVIKNNKDNTDIKEMTAELRQKLSELQLKIREKKLPVIIIFEGGKGKSDRRPYKTS